MQGECRGVRSARFCRYAGGRLVQTRLVRGGWASYDGGDFPSAFVEEAEAPYKTPLRQRPRTPIRELRGAPAVQGLSVSAPFPLIGFATIFLLPIPQRCGRVRHHRRARCPAAACRFGARRGPPEG